MLRRPINRLMRGAAWLAQTRSLTMDLHHPIVSFTFDDVPDSAFTHGARVLADKGCLGTFYIASGTLGQEDRYWRVIDAEQVTALGAAGHEIAAHTSTHANVQTLSAAALADEIADNVTTLRALCGDTPVTNFAYPFGDVSLPNKIRLQRRFSTCRGIYEGVNHGRMDRGLLKAKSLYGHEGERPDLTQTLDEAESRKGWVIFYTHDVTPDPSPIGCSPGLLAQTVAQVQARGIPCLPVDQAVALIERRGARAEPRHAGASRPLTNP